MIGIIGSECDDTRKRDNLQGSYLKKGSRGTKSYCRSRATGSRKNEKSSLGPTKLGKKSSHLIANPKSSRSSVARISCIPENVAVHFGKFYNLDESSSNDDDCCRKIGMTKTEFPDCVPPRSQFTRQMVNKWDCFSHFLDVLYLMYPQSGVDSRVPRGDHTILLARTPDVEFKACFIRVYMFVRAKCTSRLARNIRRGNMAIHRFTNHKSVLGFGRLERLAGTKYYAQQVSALLKETLEPPDFMVRFIML